MNCSSATIRKRWLGIYDRVTEHPRAHDLLPALGETRRGQLSGSRALPHGLHRGFEKKRMLLRYVRQHMEELRPALRPVAPWRGVAAARNADGA